MSHLPIEVIDSKLGWAIAQGPPGGGNAPRGTCPLGIVCESPLFRAHLPNKNTELLGGETSTQQFLNMGILGATYFDFNSSNPVAIVLTLPGLKPRGFYILRHNLLYQACAKKSRGSDSCSVTSGLSVPSLSCKI